MCADSSSHLADVASAQLTQLTQALLLPGAQLNAESIDRLRLYLLTVDTQLQLTAAEIQQLWANMPYWAFAWAGGRVLADFIQQNPQCVRSKRVLDFGCGSGMVGIAAAKAGAREVWMADLDANALAAAKLNARLNDIDDGIHIVEPGEPWPDVDMLLASDVLYDISSSADLRQLMLAIPDWLLAENERVAPGWIELKALATHTTSTLPAIGDFDECVDIHIYGRV